MASYNPNPHPSPPPNTNPSSFFTIPHDIPSNPLFLTIEDILTVLRLLPLLPNIFLPLPRLFTSTPLSELSPTPSNLRDVILHTILLASQLSLLATFPIAVLTLWAVPGIAHAIFYTSFALTTGCITWLLNIRPRTRRCLVGRPQGREAVNVSGDKRGEVWFFINGIATGTHWHQSNLTYLSTLFNRQIIGIHNPTKGLLLDILECIIQRDLNYSTRAIRVGRAQLHSALSSPDTTKVVLIAHSQGGIIAGAIIDWLYGELGDEVMGKLEVYTFASAGRILRNPLRHPWIKRREDGVNSTANEKRVLGHVEHYANTSDLVSNLGVLQFTSSLSASMRSACLASWYVPQCYLDMHFDHGDGHGHEHSRPFNQFHGPVFIHQRSGHLLNMHYLDTMFAEGSGFMETMVDLDVDGGVVQRPLGDLSRLWKYKDGRSPEDYQGNEEKDDGVNVQGVAGGFEGD
ncbi:hypothetical protein BDW74DRAFT_165276 [Aspergillus multicolor]|uniref:uncharacterized protein n=1 Tax=Aspergillus multicolor TaxID=41759 RepID=UPI003CCE3964